MQYIYIFFMLKWFTIRHIATGTYMYIRDTHVLRYVTCTVLLLYNSIFYSITIGIVYFLFQAHLMHSSGSIQQCEQCC